MTNPDTAPEVFTGSTNRKKSSVSDRHSNFRRLAQPRTEGVLEALRKLSNLSSPNYEYEVTEVEKIFDAIKRATEEAKSSFKRVKKERRPFSL